MDYKVLDRDQFRVLGNEHLKKIRKAKMESWRKFATSINSDIWGPVYRWARNGTSSSRVPNAVLRGDGTFTVTALETAECLLESLIPRDRTAPVFADECVGRDRSSRRLRLRGLSGGWHLTKLRDWTGSPLGFSGRPGAL